MAKAPKEPGSGIRVMVKFGILKKKVKGQPKTYTGFCLVTKRVADAIGLTPANPTEYVREEGEKVIVMRGSKGAKSVKIDNPSLPGNYMSLPVPGNANVKQIGAFLAPTKANRFSLGGGFYACPGEAAQAAKDAERAAAANTAAAKK